MLIAEGTSYAEGLTNMMDQMGYSAAYPTVIQSYDPADPLNEAKYGHAANGRRPVVNTGANAEQVTCYCGNTPNAPINFLAIRGLDFNPGNVAGPDVNFTGPTNYILIENNIFRYTSLTFDKWRLAAGEPRSTHHVVRMNSFYGEWHPSAHAQGIYNGGTDGLTVEDNVFWHNGWKVGVTRDEPVATGGPTIFRHPVYAQNSSTAIMYRRNLVIDAAADGGHLLGHSTATENVIIDCPIGLDMTGGVGYETVQPKGVLYEASYNAIIGAIGPHQHRSARLRHRHPQRCSGKLGTPQPAGACDQCQRREPRSVPDRGKLRLAELHGFPRQRFLPARASLGNSFAAYVDAVAGSVNHYTVHQQHLGRSSRRQRNRNVSSATFPHPYTADELYIALGFADRQTFINYAIEHPEAFLARNARALLFTGYGMN